MTVPVSRRNFLQRTAASLLSVPGLAVLGGCSQVTPSQSGNGTTGTLPQPTAPVLSGSSPVPGALNPDSLISEDEEMLSPQRASQVQFKRWIGGTYTNSASNGFFLDSDQVLPNRHWIVLLASLIIKHSANIPNIGGQYTGLFVCTPGNPAPVAYGNADVLSFRFPESDPYNMNRDNYSSTFSGAAANTYPPLVQSDDLASGTSLEVSIPLYFGMKEVIIPSNGFIRGMVSVGGVKNGSLPAGLQMQIALQVIDEANC